MNYFDIVFIRGGDPMSKSTSKSDSKINKWWGQLVWPATKKLFKFILIISLFIFIFPLIQLLSFLAVDNNVYDYLMQYNFTEFYFLFVVCAILTSLTNVVVITVCLFLFNFDINRVSNFIIILNKICFSLCIVIPTLLASTTEQFELIMTLFSFLAIFSFVFPDKYLKYLVEKSNE